MVKSFNYLKVLPVLTLLLLMIGCSPTNPFFEVLGMNEFTTFIPNEPRTYIAKYGKVWSSALGVLDEMGYVIAQMDKADGYITTEKNEGERYRDKVSLRIVHDGKEVTVRVNWYLEKKITSIDTSGTNRYYWRKGGSSGRFEKRIKDKIAGKLGLIQ